MKRSSIRRSLLISCGLGIGALLLLLSSITYVLVRRNLTKEFDASLLEAAKLLSHQVDIEDGEVVHEWRDSLPKTRPTFGGVLFQFWNERNGDTAHSPDLRWKNLPKFTGADGALSVREIALPDGHPGRAVGMRIYPIIAPEEMAREKERGERVDPTEFPHILVVARDATPMQASLTRLGWVLGVGSALTLAIGFLIINQAIRTALHPLDHLTKQVRERSEQQLDSALEVPASFPLELEGLARDFDSLLARVAKIRERERDFIRHAAHELRTPLAGLRATCDLALSQPRESAAYVRHLLACQKSSIELGELVHRLASLAKLGEQTALIKLLPIDVGIVADELVAMFRTAADARGLKILRQPCHSSLEIASDPALLRIILTNLLDNAVSYAAAGSLIALDFDRSDDHLELVVSNTVSQLPEDPERLFEPLFRHDPSRHDSSSHLGIGLTLSRDAAHALKGSLQARVLPEEQRVAFVMRLRV